MKILFYAAGATLLLAVLGLSGTVLIQAVSGPENWAGYLQRLDDRRWPAFALSAVTLLSLALFIIAGFYQDGREQLLSFDAEGGDVSITLKAANDYLTRFGMEFAAIHSLKPHIRIDGNALDIALDLKVVASAQIPELCQVLQQRVREGVRQNLGFSEIKCVRINVREIVSAAAIKNKTAAGG